MAVVQDVARDALRLIGWNAAWLVAGLICIAAAGEIWLRLTTPFATNSRPSQFIRRGHRIEDAHWAHDLHWNPTGHRWAAEVLLEHLHRHPETCSGSGERILDSPNRPIR